MRALTNNEVRFLENDKKNFGDEWKNFIFRFLREEGDNWNTGFEQTTIIDPGLL